MTIPLDSLYNYIEGMAQGIHGNAVLIYRFWPHGSKKFEDLRPLRNIPTEWKDKKITPQIFCNDQEPLNYDYYEHVLRDVLPTNSLSEKFNDPGLISPRKNFRIETFSLWDHALLLHSEQRSQDVSKYQKADFLPVYYWSHAVIARDWFRYAEHLTPVKKNHRRFLIYSRGWTGTREYRLKFLELLCVNHLSTDCKTVIEPVDANTNTHYHDHDFLQEKWRPAIDLEKHFVTGTISSNLSADFDLADYENTEIEVVLETLFDDSRLHFTEKILRPIALGQPFILVGAHGGLEYLKQYGFQTFGNIWNEDYDHIENPEQRLQAVVSVMKSIKQWNHSQRQAHMQQAQAIADHNRQRFFSKEFFAQIIDELKHNLGSALQDLHEKNTSSIWYNFRQKYHNNIEVQRELLKIRPQQDADIIYQSVLKYHNRQQHS